MLNSILDTFLNLEPDNKKKLLDYANCIINPIKIYLILLIIILISICFFTFSTFRELKLLKSSLSPSPSSLSPSPSSLSP